MLEWSDSGSGTQPGVCHTGGESSQKPLVSGPLGAEHVARIQVKAQRAEGEEEGNLGREDNKTRWFNALLC